jgi:5-formyltetrahydrofolate cyclo-ligase
MFKNLVLYLSIGLLAPGVPLAVCAESPTETTAPPRTQINLGRSMNLAGENLVHMLNPKYDYLPNFLIAVEPDLSADQQMFFMSHNIGRWIDAMYRLEKATGFAAAKNIQDAMLRNVKSFCDNPDDLFLRPLDKFPHDKGDLFCFHSLREQLGALHALAKYKNSDWARERAHRMIAALDRLLLPEEEWRARSTVWDIARTKRYQAEGCKEVFWGWSPNLQGSEGRLIEPLLWIYELTGNALALEMAHRFARFHLDLSTRPDGSFYSPELGGHNHSYMGTLRGLLYYGRVTGQHQYVDAIARTYEKAVQRIVRKSGFTTHDLHRDHGGDLASAADVTQMALWLGVHHGYSEHLDDVQRLVISRLLASQITESPALTPKRADRKPGTTIMPDGRFAFVEYPENMEKIIIGALGGIYGRAHGGKWSVTDVTSSALSVLVSVYNNIAVQNDQEIRVHFHFDHETEFIRIRAKRERVAKVVLEPRVKKNLLVRIPGWAPRESVQLTVKGEPLTPNWIGPFVLIDRDLLPARVELQYDLPVHKEREKAAGTEFEITWRGDEIIGICPNTDFYPFFPTAPGCE